MTDPLADVFRSIRFCGGIFLDSHLTAPWSVLAQLTPADCQPYMIVPEHVIPYHFVIQGRLLLTPAGGETIEVHAGEVVMLPRNDGHVLASAPGLPTLIARDLIRPGPDGGLPEIRHGGGGTPTQFVCGLLASDDPYNPLVSELPRVLKIGVREGSSQALVEASVRFAAEEVAAGRPAASGVMARLVELLFIDAVRNHVATLREDAHGWLRAVADPQIGRALGMIHQDLSADLSPDGLARAVGMSRTAFITRFSALVGMPPIRYLTIWRLQFAKRQLRESRASIAQLAHTIGYESEAAFTRAFKRAFGLPPARWRDEMA